MKNHDFTPKNHIFSNFRGRAPGASPPPFDPPLCLSPQPMSVNEMILVQHQLSNFVAISCWEQATFYEMTNQLSWIFIVLAHCNKSLRIDMSLHWDTLVWFRVNQSLLLPLNAVCLAEEALWFYQKVPWNWYQHARVFDWQHICYVWWMCFSTVGIPMGTNCAQDSSRRLVPLFVWGRLHTGGFSRKVKRTKSIL